MNISKYRENRRKQIGAGIHDIGKKLLNVININWFFERTSETDKPRMTD